MEDIHEIIEKTCQICGSSDVVLEQDNHHSTTADGAKYGVITCNVCGHLAFWFLKIKQKIKLLEGGKIEITCRPAFAVVNCWDGPITQFLFERMERSSEKTGRPLTTYYTTYSFHNRDTTVRYWQIERVKE